MLSKATDDEQLQLMHDWFTKTKKAPVALTTAHMHTIVRTIYKSEYFSMDVKTKALKALKEIDTSDKFGLTEKYCQAATPTIENKREVWNLLFGSESNKLGLYEIEYLC